MLIDITLKVTPEILKEAEELKNPALAGHLGTHFDSMNKEFPLEYTKRKGIIFDVSKARNSEIDCDDIDLTKVEKGMFIALYSGFIERVGYGETGYFREHPVLSYKLIEALVAKGVSIIALDFGGIRRSPEHVPADRYCADRGTFVIENLVNLKTLLEKGGEFTAHTYPMNLVGLTGLPCRVIAEI